MSSHAPTKRELREQRRAARLAAEQASAAKDARRRRGWILAGAAGLAAVAVVLAVALTSSSDKPPAVSSVAAASSLFAGIPEHNGVLGDPKAPVTVTEYLDPQCPICDEASTEHAPAARARLRQDRQGQAPGAHAALHRPGLGPCRQGRRRRRASGPPVAVPGDVLRQPGRGELRLRDRRVPAPGRRLPPASTRRPRWARPTARSRRAACRSPTPTRRSSASTRRPRSRSPAVTGRRAWSARACSRRRSWRAAIAKELGR